MTRYHSINGENIAFSPEEETARNEEEAVWTAGDAERKLSQVKSQRKTAYQMESDGLFFKEQAGELDSGVWQAKRNEIKARFPKEE